MPINTLERVLWRIRSNKQGNTITIQQFKKAIIQEAGYSEQTYYRIKRSLVTLGWIKTEKTRIILTGKDINEA